MIQAILQLTFTILAAGIFGHWQNSDAAGWFMFFFMWVMMPVSGES